VRISFDLDDTLICATHVPKDPGSWLSRRFFREHLRLGTRQLLNGLRAEGHELWVYTSSPRSRTYIWCLFACNGIRLRGVVNEVRHQKTVKSMPRPRPSKYPKAFSIDLHIDDLPGVAEEGARHGFQVLVVDPTDEGWAAVVLQAVGGW
jgi:hypothetical protein